MTSQGIEPTCSPRRNKGLWSIKETGTIRSSENFLFVNWFRIEIQALLSWKVRGDKCKSYSILGELYRDIKLSCSVWKLKEWFPTLCLFAASRYTSNSAPISRDFFFKGHLSAIVRTKQQQNILGYIKNDGEFLYVLQLVSPSVVSLIPILAFSVGVALG
jgi:hypothetical protein